MTYKGISIGRKPTFEQVKEAIQAHDFDLDAMEVYLFWEHKHWTTNKGTPIKTLENAINVANGVIIDKRIREEKIPKQNKSKQKSIAKLLKLKRKEYSFPFLKVK